MPQDPIERLILECEVYGIPQEAGAPPMTQGYLQIRYRPDGSAESAVMGLPAYEGKPGPRGLPGALHQGSRTTGELNALGNGILGEAQTNYAYRNSDTNDQYVWDGDSWVIYPDVYSTPGPVGPPPSLASGDLTIDGEVVDAAEYGVRLTGADGVYAVSLDLPPMPQGEQGDTGPSGSVFTSVDVDNVASTRAAGKTLVVNEDNTKLEWVTADYYTEEYVVPPANFPDVSKSSSDLRHVMVTMTIPAKTYPYRFDFSGGVDVNSKTGHLINLEIRRDNATTGPLIGIGKGQDGEGWREVAFRAYTDQAIDPSSNYQVVPAGQEVTIYASAVKVAGNLLGWNIRKDQANLRVRLMRVKG